MSLFALALAVSQFAQSEQVAIAEKDLSTAS